jgi:16S rRNA processing protein RimM
MSAIDPEGLILMGRVMRGHGIKGEIKVFCETEDPHRFEGLDRVFVGWERYSADAHAVESVRFQEHAKKGTLVLLKLAEVDDRTAADQLRGADIYSPEDDLPPLEEGQLFLHDMIGLRVEMEDGTYVGEVKDIMRLPAHDTFVIAREEKSDALVPDVEEFVVSLDVEEQLLRIAPIDGLLE